MFELTCMSCHHVFEGTISFDELGWHSSCPECGASFDVDVPDGRIKMFFMDTEHRTSDFFDDYYRGAAVCSFYAFDNVKDFIAKWKEISENPDSMWYWCYDGEIKDENCFCSGACDPDDIENFMEHFHCDENGNHVQTPMERFKADMTAEMSRKAAHLNNTKYLWAKYNPKTDRFDDKDGQLVYQKQLNGLFYDASTNKPLVPQPTFYVKLMLAKGRHLAKKYIPTELGGAAHA